MSIRTDLSYFDIEEDQAELLWSIDIVVGAIAGPDNLPTRCVPLEAGPEQAPKCGAEAYHRSSFAVQECSARVRLFDPKRTSRYTATIRQYEFPDATAQPTFDSHNNNDISDRVH